MPSQPRYMILDDNSVFHITWQCHNQSWLLEPDWAKAAYYDLLLRYKKRYKVQIYSYCFMDNHPHLSGYCESKELLSDFFRLVNSCFARTYNKKNKRRGQVVMDRFKSPRIQTDADLLKVMHYIDLNPKRAGKVDHPKDYRWSSYAFYAYGKADPLIDPAPIYLELANTPKERQKIYRSMVRFILQNDWKQKKPYSSLPFIGNPEWVAQKTQELQLARQQKYRLWKKNFKEKFSNSS